MIPNQMIGTRFGTPQVAATKNRIGERRLDTQSVVQGNIEELNRFIAQNEQQLRVKEKEVIEAKKHIDSLESQLHQLQTNQKTLDVKIQNEQRFREEITQRTRKVQLMYVALKEHAAKLADSFKKTEEMCDSAVAENSNRDAIIRDLVEKITKIDERARQREAEFTDHISFLKSRIEEKQAEFDKASAELSAALDKSDEEKRELTARICALDKEISEIAGEKDRLSLERDSTSERLQKLTSEKQELELSLQEAIDRFKALEGSHNDLMGQFNEMSSDCELKRNELAEQAKTIAEMRTEIAGLEEKLREKCDEIASQLERSKQAEEDWSARLEKAHGRESSLTAEKESLLSKLAEANRQLELIPELKLKVEELESSLRSLRDSNADLTCQCEKFTKEIELKNLEKNRESDRFREELRVKDFEKNEIGSLCYLFAEKINLLEGDVDAIKCNLELTKQELIKCDSKIGQLTTEVKQRDVAITGLQSDLANVVRKSEALAEEKEQLSKVLEEKKQSIASLKSERQSLIDKIANKESDLASKSEEIGELTAKIDILNSSVDISKSSVKEAEVKWLRERADLLEKVRITEKSVAQFTIENDALQGTILSQEQKLNAMRSEKNEADKAKRAAESELEEKLEELAKLKEEFLEVKDDFGQKLASQREKVLQLEEEISEKGRKFEEALQKSRDKSALLAESENKLSELEKELEKVRLEKVAQKPIAERTYVKSVPEKEGPQQDARRSPRLARKSLAERPNPLITVTNAVESPGFMAVLTQQSPGPRRQQQPKATPSRAKPPRLVPATPSRLKAVSELAKSTPSFDFDSGSEDAESSKTRDDSADETWLPTAQKKSRKSAPPILAPSPAAVKATPKRQPVADKVASAKMPPPPKPAVPAKQDLPGPVRKVASGAPKRIYLNQTSAPAKPKPSIELPKLPAAAKNVGDDDPFAFLGDD